MPPLQEKSILLNDQTLSSESREEFFTCNSSITLPPIDKPIDDKPLKTPATESHFDTSFLPPPPPVDQGFIRFRLNQPAEINTQLVSYIGNVKRVQANYVICPIK